MTRSASARPRPTGRGVEGLTKESLNFKKSPFNEEDLEEETIHEIKDLFVVASFRYNLSPRLR